MIVPFLFDIWEYTEYPKLLAVFYKFLNFSLKYDFPIVAQEKYFLDPKLYKGKNFATEKLCSIYHDYKLITKKDIDSAKKIVITKAEEKILLGELKNEKEKVFSILSSRNKKFEKLIEKIIMQLEEQDKIKAFMVWNYLPSLDYVAKKHGIKIINLEYTAIRKPYYRDTLCYFKFCNKYESKDVQNDYKKLEKDIKNQILFSRKELLALLLDTEFIDKIKLLYKPAKYELGYALGIPNDYFEEMYSKTNFSEVMEKLKKSYKSNEVSVRQHPGKKYDKLKIPFHIDTSDTTSDWISKCKRIICDISGSGYEAMLYGKSVVHISDALPTSFNSWYNLDYVNDDIIGIDKLSFLTFYCYTPRKLCFDLNYINWRLTNPSLYEIYMRHLEFILSECNLRLSDLKQINKKDRFDYILSHGHKLTKAKIKELNNYNYSSVYEQYKKDRLRKEELELKNQGLLEDINKISIELQETLNSNSWRITKPVRFLSEKIKKIKIK